MLGLPPHISTLSLDFAQGSATIKGGDIKDPKGVNIKYRYEMDSTWGGLASLTYEKVKHKPMECRQSQG
ncbi:Ail/Lom family outer membrane beta-barrel protein [Escherichia coli]|uniref:Ail/Lom family outer membrane beta-barrel protein n=1 Tax=Escherichia coli TaxID=562 RepID=UPI00259FFA77|nr:Ail/Lom family outer membrane beta-barrel protein [Escherichia coli]MDM6721758.1 Ail/Lom family outer membrane beta-barrel protein [Escherichia coli]